MDSMDLRDSPMNTDQKHERSDRISSGAQKQNFRRQLEAERMKDKVKAMESKHEETLDRMAKEIADIRQTQSN